MKTRRKSPAQKRFWALLNNCSEVTFTCRGPIFVFLDANGHQRISFSPSVWAEGRCTNYCLPYAVSQVLQSCLVARGGGDANAVTRALKKLSELKSLDKR